MVTEKRLSALQHECVSNYNALDYIKWLKTKKKIMRFYQLKNGFVQ